MRFFLFSLLLFTGITGFAQLPVIPGIVGSSTRFRGEIDVPEPEEMNIEQVDITTSKAQYIGSNVTMTANANGASVTSWRWRVLRRYFHTGGRVDTLLHQVSNLQNPTFSLDTIGFYDIQLIARNGLDKYFVYQSRLFHVFPPRFTEAEADIVINMSVPGSKFYDFRGDGPQPGLKIYIKGQTANGQVQFVDLRGTEDDPVYIIKENNNIQTQIQFTGGNGKVLHFSRFGVGEGARHVIINGFNLDGTPGLKVIGGAASIITVRIEGKVTDIGVFGLEVVANPSTIDGAGIAIGPYVAADCSKTTWETNNIQVYGCTITSGEEGVYLGESNQSPGYVGNNGFPPPSGIGAVVSRNIVLGAGRDAYQIGCMMGECEDNYGFNYGQQGESGHKACLNNNDGAAVAFRRNYCYGGPMFASLKSGEYPWAPLSGQTSPQPCILDGNIFSSGTYVNPGSAEPFSIYVQNNPNSGAGNWTVKIRNNAVDSDNKSCEFFVILGGFTSYNFEFSNNIIIKTGNAGDSPALNFTGNGKATLQGGTKTENNLVYNRGADLSGLYFADYANANFEITSTSSAAYGGSPASTTLIKTDYLGFPIDVPGLGRFYGPYSIYNKRMINP